VVILISSAVLARTWYITSDGTGDAPTIQAGIDSAAVGDTVLVAAGTYSGPCQATPDGPSMLVVDSGLHLIAEDGPDVTILDGQGLCRVLHCRVLSDSFSLKGFTVTGGDARDDAGGGLYCTDCPALVSNCVFSENEAAWGGGVCLVGGVTVSDCEICFNTAAVNQYGFGGGAYCVYATLIECDIHDNYASEEGGGLYAFGNVSGCVFSANSAGWAGGAFAGGDLSNCLFFGNTGEGSCYHGVGYIDSCTFLENSGSCLCGTSVHAGPMAYGCTFYRNSGSALKVGGASGGTLTDCTIYGNAGDAVVLIPGWSHGDGTYVVLRNTIIAYTLGGVAVSSCSSLECRVTMECCCLWQNEDGDYVGGIAGQEGVNGNLSACPSFCQADLDPFDLHLCNGSPCLAGNHPEGYDCGLIGAWGEGCACGPTSTRPSTWGAIKATYR
jgi:hypothetical protein